MESEKIRHGLLTYALVHDGLTQRGATGQDGTITLAGWLRYAEQRVESLYTEVLEGRVRGPGNAESVDSRIALLSRDGRGYRNVTL